MGLNFFESGFFSWKEWSENLSEYFHEAQQVGDLDLGETYYVHWVKALEELIVEKNILQQDELRERREKWLQAYINTLHGKTIELKG